MVTKDVFFLKRSPWQILADQEHIIKLNPVVLEEEVVIFDGRYLRVNSRIFQRTVSRYAYSRSNFIFGALKKCRGRSSRSGAIK